MEELSMLIEKVQEQIYAQKQLQIRRLLLRLPFSSRTNHHMSLLCEGLSQAGLLGDPIDNLRPASVGHIIYLLARYRSIALASTLSFRILHKISHEDYSILAKETVRHEYEYCANFLDVMSQSTELLRNLRRAQQTSVATNETSDKVKGILCKSALTTYGEELLPSEYKQLRKSAHITKTESIDKFISASFGENCLRTVYKPSEQLKQMKPMLLHNSIDEEKVDERCEKKKNIQWSDYCEVSLRHQVVGRYLQLTWRGLSNCFDGGFQFIFPSSTSDVISWPTCSSSGIQETVDYLQSLNEIGKETFKNMFSLSKQIVREKTPRLKYCLHFDSLCTASCRKKFAESPIGQSTAVDMFN